MIEPEVETFRWKTAVRHTWVGDAPAKDADGALRVVNDGDWIAVVYPQDGGHGAFVETVERAPAERRIEIVHAGRSGDFSLVTSVLLESSVGRFGWESDFQSRYDQIERGQRAPISKTFRPGTLVLPDGQKHRTTRGSGFFEVPGLVRAYDAWRDSELEAGWTVVTEVLRSAPDAWRPLLAAFPLLLFPYPPHV